MRRLYDVAKVLRSKNAGPFSITLDVLFENKRDYEQVKRQGIISREVRRRMRSRSWFISIRPVGSR